MKKKRVKEKDNGFSYFLGRVPEEMPPEEAFNEMLSAYGARWKIEEFHRQIKQDFSVENVQMKRYEALRNMMTIVWTIASYFVLALLVFGCRERQISVSIEIPKDVVKTISEINNTAQQLFKDTFDKIRENFIKIFRGLFNPGDEADLRIEEDADPLEAKIEIIAKPKGKRPTSIDLLSGGEKTLTAIALLFAIYLVKPSPFCILDEIDAPLDDANIDRFTKIIRDFSTDTQFIVVTHNKRTMEAADTMYGVTMQEEGISKLVSVRFNEDLNFASA